MSSPSINRWGLNLFWYRFWYLDKNYSNTVSQDSIIEQLLLIYIHYGITSFKNFFLNNYWYSNLTSLIKTSNIDINSKYFRTVSYKSRVVEEIKSYKIRLKVKNLYHSKIWLLRYQNWLVLNFFTYQPLKKKQITQFFKTKTKNLYLDNNRKNSVNFLYRLKFYVFYFLKSTLQKNNYYIF